MIGFASFIALGGIAHLWQRIPGTRYNERTMNWVLLASCGGLTLMVADLTIAGLVEGQVWASERTMDGVRPRRCELLVGPYVLRAADPCGFVLFCTSLVPARPFGSRNSSGQPRSSEGIPAFEGDASISHEPPSTGGVPLRACRHLRRGAGFLRFRSSCSRSFQARNWKKSIEQVAPVTMPALTASETEGQGRLWTRRVRLLSHAADRSLAESAPLWRANRSLGDQV